MAVSDEALLSDFMEAQSDQHRHISSEESDALYRYCKGNEPAHAELAIATQKVIMDCGSCLITLARRPAPA
jgi:hypothetical protein